MDLIEFGYGTTFMSWSMHDVSAEAVTAHDPASDANRAAAQTASGLGLLPRPHTHLVVSHPARQASPST